MGTLKINTTTDNLSDYQTKAAYEAITEIYSILHDKYCPNCGTHPNETIEISKLLDMIDEKPLTTKEKMYLTYIVVEQFVNRVESEEEQEEEEVGDEMGNWDDNLSGPVIP